MINFDEDVSSSATLSDTVEITVSDTHLQTTSLEYGFSPDNICDATDTYGNSFSSGGSFVINIEDQNGQYICAKAEDFSGNISYASSANALNIELPDPNSAGSGITTSSSVDSSTTLGTKIGFAGFSFSLPLGASWTPKYQKEIAEKFDQGWAPRIKKTKNQYGFEIFSSYVPGKIDIKKFIKVRPLRSFGSLKAILLKENDPDYEFTIVKKLPNSLISENSKSKISGKNLGARTPKASIAKRRPGQEILSAIARKSQIERLKKENLIHLPPQKISPPRLSENINMIRLKIGSQSIRLGSVIKKSF